MNTSICFGHSTSDVIEHFSSHLLSTISATIFKLLERTQLLKQLYMFRPLTDVMEWKVVTTENSEDINKALSCLDDFVRQFRLDSRAAALEMLMFASSGNMADAVTQTNFPPVACVLGSELEGNVEEGTELPGDQFNKIHLVVHNENSVHTNFSPQEKSTKCEKKPKWLCNVCNKEFKCQSALTTHVRIHTGEKPFVCETCGASFVQKQSLIFHRKTHKHKEHTCETCGLTFTLLRGLREHLRTHTGDRPFVCDVCGRAYLRRTNLRDHQTTHSGEKRYKCQYCGKMFRKWCSKQKHERIHDSERPFPCSLCSKTFTQKYNLKVHMRTHEKCDSSSKLKAESPVL
nr:zinc finger protein 782 [Ciona intestinalis]|eukprot:XP_009862497.1 zinc finger protein 782 [Ciona intestinalis]